MASYFRPQLIRRLSTSAAAVMSFLPSVTNPQYAEGLVDVFTAEAVNGKQISSYPWGGDITEVDGTYLYKATNNKYYARSLPGGTINLGWFLREGEDNYERVQGFFNFLIRTGAGSRRMAIVVPAGRYYFSKTLSLHSLQLIITGLGATFEFAPGIRMLELRRMSRHEFFSVSYITFSAKGKVADGYINSDDSSYAAFLRDQMLIQPGDMSRGGEGYLPQPTGITAPGEKVVQIKSLRAQDYKLSGVYANTPVTLHQVEVEYASGHGVELDGRKIYTEYYPLDPFAPYGYNTNLSKLYGGECRGCGGAGVAIYGSDGNQCTIDSWSTRNNWLNFYSDCQEGNRFLNCHATSSQWGNFVMLGTSAGDDITNCYSEGDSTINKFNGYTVVTGGRMDRNAYRKGPFAQVNLTYRTTGLSIETLSVTDSYTFQGAAVAFRQNMRGNNLQWSIEGVKGVGETLASMARSAATNRGGLPLGTGSRSHSIGGVLYVAASSISDLVANYPARWQVSDEVTIDSTWDGHRPRKYVCVKAGLSGPLTYNQLEGCVASNADGGTQNLNLNKPSSILTSGDSIQIDGVDMVVGNGRQNPDGDITYFEIGSPGIRITAGNGIITYPAPEFRAVSGGAAGSSTQRPTASLRAVDIGFEYYDSTLKKPIFWDATAFRDAMANIV